MGCPLGHIIGPNVSHDVFQDASFTLIRCVNSVLSNFRHCSYGVKYQLFISYCTSFYGCPLWNVSDKYVNNFYISSRKAIRKIFDLPYKTHTNTLPIISECHPMPCQLLCRMLKCICNALSSPNIYLRLLMNIATQGSRSPVSQNFNYIFYKCNVQRNIFNNDHASCYMLDSLNKSFRPSDEAF